MIKKRIVVDIEWANEWQQDLHEKQLLLYLDVIKQGCKEGLGMGQPKSCKNKKNNLKYTVYEVSEEEEIGENFTACCAYPVLKK